MPRVKAKTPRGYLIEFDRKPVDPHRLYGIALGWSDDLTLLQLVNPDTMDVDGYSVIRNSDVRRWRPLGPKTFMARALKLRGIKAAFRDTIVLGDWRVVLETAGALFPLLTLQREKMNPHACHIGKVHLMTAKTVTLKTIDPDAKWAERRQFRFADLTRVDFGGAYEEALMMVAADRGR